MFVLALSACLIQRLLGGGVIVLSLSEGRVPGVCAFLRIPIFIGSRVCVHSGI